jgi:hypothetical protein
MLGGWLFYLLEKILKPLGFDGSRIGGGERFSIGYT